MRNIISVNGFAAKGEPQVDVTDEEKAITAAVCWAINDADDVAGEARLGAAVDAVLRFKNVYGLSIEALHEPLDAWNRVACDEPLTPVQLAAVVEAAFAWPWGDQPGVNQAPPQAAPGAAPIQLQGGPGAALAPLHDGAQLAARPEPAGHLEPLLDDSPPLEGSRQRRCRLSGAERMRRRRAKLRQLGLSGESKGRLTALKVTATGEIVTHPVTPTAEIVTPGDSPTTPTGEIVTATAGIVTPKAEVANV
jgi:hypothetical protein